MITVTSLKTGRRYEARTTQYGSSNIVTRLYYGGIYLAGTDQPGMNGESSSSIELTIFRADQRAANLQIDLGEDQDTK